MTIKHHSREYLPGWQCMPAALINESLWLLAPITKPSLGLWEAHYSLLTAPHLLLYLSLFTALCSLLTDILLYYYTAIILYNYTASIFLTIYGSMFSGRDPLRSVHCLLVKIHLQNTRYSFITVWHILLTAQCSPSIVYFLMLTALKKYSVPRQCYLIIANCSILLVTAHCLMLTGLCLMLDAYCSLIIAP